MGITEIEAAAFMITGALLIIGCLFSYRGAASVDVRNTDLLVIILALLGLGLLGFGLLDVFVDHQ